MRKTMLVTVLLSVMALTTAATVNGADGVRGRFDRPRDGFAPPETVLRAGSPSEAGLAAWPIERAERRIAEWTERTPGRQHPMYAGAVSLVAHDGIIVGNRATGYELRYADGNGTELPPGEREPARENTIFDLASMTKLFTSIAVLQQVEEGRIELTAPVANYLPEFGVNGKSRITVRQLLTHTSGLQSVVRLWELPPEQRIPHVMSLKPENEPGSTYNYSDPNMIVLGELVERVSDKGLDQVVTERITGPLGMTDTGYNPPRRKLHRVAATEYQTDPDRGMVRGQVHDENAWSLGGVAGHAGVFGTARDLAKLGQAVLNGGTYAGERILSPDSVETMLSNYNEEFPEHAHGLGFELNQRWYMAGLSAPRGAGHTGYTGTSMVLDPASDSMAILLTNRVHPSREWGSNNPARVELAQGLARSMAVPPRHGDSAWFTGGDTDQREATLTTRPLRGAEEKVGVEFDAFVDTQRDPDGVDRLRVEVSTDGGRNWRPITLRAHGPGAPRDSRDSLAGSGHRSWWRVSGRVDIGSAGPVKLRWRYTPDERYVGRGVYLDGISVFSAGDVLLDGEREPGGLVGDGFAPARR